MIRAALAHIDKKRADLGLVPWDAERYGQSGGDDVMEEILSLPPGERYLYSRRVVERA